MSDPITDDLHKANWLDYVSNWRQKDAGYLQERSILRYGSAAIRTTEWPSPKAGQTTYNAASDRLEMYSALRSSWISLMLFQYLASTDTSTGVTLSHTSASGGGIVLSPTGVTVSMPLTVSAGALAGVLVADNTGVKIKTGTKTALLTTDNANLFSDTPLTVPAVSVSGALTAASGTIASLAATSATITTLNISGTLGGGGVLNGSSGKIGGVSLGSNYVQADSGYVSQAGYFRGDGGTALMSYRNPGNGSVGGPQLYVNAGGGGFNNGGVFDFNTTVRLLNASPLLYYNSNNSIAKNVAPSFYDGGVPDVNQYPEGTIYVN